MIVPRFMPSATVVGALLGWVRSLFGGARYSDQYTSELRSFYGKKYVLLFPQARIALYAIMKSLLPKGSEVLIAAYNVPVVVEYLEASGVKLKFVDSEPGGFNIDVVKVIDSLGPETRAVVISHMYGISVDFSELVDICRKRNILILEDAAQAFGSMISSADPRFHKKLCGTVADIGVFSTGIFKKFSTMLGGFVLTDNSDIYQALKSFKEDHRRSLSEGAPILSAMIESFSFIFASNKFLFPVLFFFMKKKIHNVNMEDEKTRGAIDPDTLPCSFLEGWQSALGVQSFAHYEKTVDPFSRNSFALQNRLSASPQSDPKLCQYLHYPVRFRKRRSAIEEMNAIGYDVGPGKFFNYGGAECPVAETAVRQNVNLPLHRGVVGDGVEQIADVVERCQEGEG